MTLVDLFKRCDYPKDYIHIEENVSYKFVEDGDILYIYFQHSNGKLDWKHNLMFKKTPYTGMKISYRVHGGFLKCWKIVEDVILKKITEADIDNPGTYRWNQIYVIGYSHGAALAMLCHEFCWFHRNDIAKAVRTIAFEPPRVFADYSIPSTLTERWKNFIVIRNCVDIVTHLPPWIFGYCHAGRIIHIGKGKNYGLRLSHWEPNVIEALSEYEHNIDWDTALF